MKFEFEKVTDYNLIAPAIITINSENTKIISTSKLINNLRLISIVPQEEKQILKNRSDDKFSQKIRNLISHKVLEKYNLAKSSKNKIELTNHGKRLGKLIHEKLIGQDLTHIASLVKNLEYKKNLLMAKLDINFDPYLFEKLESCDFSVRAKNLIKDLNIKYIGDLANNISQKQIMKLPNSGKKTFHEIEDFLIQKKLRLEMRTNWNNLDNKGNLAKEYSKNQVKDVDFNIDNIISSYLIKKTKESEINFERKKKIIKSRFGLDGRFSTLEAIGNDYKVSRERIRQIQQKFSVLIKNKENVKYAIKKLIKFISAQTPVLESVLGELLIRENFFNSYKDIPNLRSIISSFTKFTFDSYLLSNYQFQRSYNMDQSANTKSQFTQEFLISSKKEEKIINSIVTHSRKWTTKYSYCNFDKLISVLFKTSNYSKYNNVKNSLKLHENFLWFDDENFMALDTAGQTTLKRLKKLLFIHKKISFEDFIGALLNDNRIGTAPPTELLQKICKANDLKFDQNYIYYSGEEIEIPDLESKIIKLFKENDKFLTFWECINLSEDYGIKYGSLAMMMYGSYLVKKLDNKVFCLFGTEIDNKKINLAAERSKKETKLNKDLDININWTKEKKILLQFKLTRIILLQGFIFINSTWDKILEGSYYNYQIKEDIRVGHAVWNLKEILKKFKLGSQVNLEFSFDPTKTVRVF